MAQMALYNLFACEVTFPLNTAMVISSMNLCVIFCASIFGIWSVSFLAVDYSEGVLTEEQIAYQQSRALSLLTIMIVFYALSSFFTFFVKEDLRRTNHGDDEKFKKAIN